MRTTDILSQKTVEKHLKFGDIFDICCYDTVSSTNILLKQAGLEGASEGTVIMAESQTAGKGRMGRSFHSPDGSGLYMSLLLKPDLATAGKITTMAAVAVCRAIGKTLSKEVDIKWVNDILLDGKKKGKLESVQRFF